MILVFLGPPGSGKGTQARQLASRRGWPQLSTGDIFRSAIQAGSTLGLKVKQFLDKGELVPDDAVIEVIRDRIQASDCREGFILDGFPRTLPQAEALDKMLQSLKRRVDRVVLFNLSEPELVRRLSGRRTCEKCGTAFHIELNTPRVAEVCDQCGGKLIHRPDDQPDVIQKRMRVYQQQTQPLVSFYEKQGKLGALSAGQSVKAVEEALEGILGA